MTYLTLTLGGGRGECQQTCCHLNLAQCQSLNINVSLPSSCPFLYVLLIKNALILQTQEHHCLTIFQSMLVISQLVVISMFAISMSLVIYSKIGLCTITSDVKMTKKRAIFMFFFMHFNGMIAMIASLSLRLINLMGVFFCFGMEGFFPE